MGDQKMNYKLLGKGIVIMGILFLVASFYFYPVSFIPGSIDNPTDASYFQSMETMISASENKDFPKSFYVETTSMTLATQEADNTVSTLTFQRGTRYEKSFVFTKELTKNEYISLARNDDVIGIWDIPRIMFQNLNVYSNVGYQDYGDMDDAMSSTNTDSLISQGQNGENTIIVIIDGFPSESEFYQYFPDDWRNRVLHYPSEYQDSKHGIMTASISAYVSPKSKLYFLQTDDDMFSNMDMILGLKKQYPDHSIVSSNSYVFTGTMYYNDNHPLNRKILEVADNGIAVVFGAGNWAHEGEHNSQWTMNVGYDSRNGMFNRNSEIGYPAVFNKVVSVSACNAYGDKILSYSSLGPGVDGYDEPDVSAPSNHHFMYSPYDGLTSGTSASTPFMAGIIADILTNKDCDSERLVGVIHQTSNDLGKTGFDDEFGYGVVDALGIYNSYDAWIPTPTEKQEIYVYGISIIMIIFGFILIEKDEILKIIGS
jgi:hypothetical protein